MSVIAYIDFFNANLIQIWLTESIVIFIILFFLFCVIYVLLCMSFIVAYSLHNKMLAIKMAIPNLMVFWPATLCCFDRRSSIYLRSQLH